MRRLNLFAVTKRTLIADLKRAEAGEVTVGGWVETVRDQKRVQFIVLRDESGAAQLVRGKDETPDEISEIISSLTHGSFISATGQLKHDERVKLGGLEVEIESVVLHSLAEPEPPIAPDSHVDKKMDWRFIDLRQAENNLIFRAQTTFLHAIRSWWVEHGFIEIQTPKTMASPSESRAELFELQYFDTTAYLAQSPQFFKQMAQSAGFGKIFEIGPAFRADPSFTSRHLTEFTSIDVEMSFIDDHRDVMAMQEQVLTAGLTAVAEKHGEEITAAFGIELKAPSLPFPRVTLEEAHQILEAGGYTVPRQDGDLDPEGERRLSAHILEQTGSPFVFVTDYPITIRPFYHMRKADQPKLTNSYDLIYNGVEISTGAQREHRVDTLIVQAVEKKMDPAELDFYLDFFRHGAPPHGGFGMGLNRVMALMLGRSSVRETTYLFRGPNRLAP